jgi:pilus assembly protein CpaB
MRQKLLLLAAVFFGILAFVLTFHQIKMAQRRALGETMKVTLIQLNKDKIADQPLASEDLVPLSTKRFRTASKREIPWTKRNLIIGKKLATSLNRGAIIQWSDLQIALKGSKELSDLIKSGNRAISISVDATASVTGLVLPGNNVDIIGTFRFPEMKGDKSFDTLTLTILQNVKVLATGTDMGGAVFSGMSPARRRKGYSTVTLSLTPKEVEMIIFASQKGRLTLSLRNKEESRIEKNLQSVNFDYLQKHIKDYNLEREKRTRPGYHGRRSR